MKLRNNKVRRCERKRGSAEKEKGEPYPSVPDEIVDER
jgi:hypothetical protein